MGCNFQEEFLQVKKDPNNFKRFGKAESYNPKSCGCLNQKCLLCKGNNKVATDAVRGLVLSLLVRRAAAFPCNFRQHTAISGKASLSAWNFGVPL